MKFSKFIIPVTVVSIFSCGSGVKTKEVRTEEGSRESETLRVEPAAREVTEEDGAYFIPLQAGEGEISLTKAPQETVYVEFRSGDYRKLYAEVISSDGNANLRFSEIFLPSGRTDGPFGQQIRYDLLQEGTYRLSIHENMMAGDPWGGELTVKVRLSGRPEEME